MKKDKIFIKKALLTIILFLLYQGFSFGQVGPEYVDLSTGRVNINVPLYQYSSASNGLSLDISLNYNSAGVKMDGAPSNVGQDWSLNAGGVIRRRMVGGLDDKYPEGAMYNSGPVLDDKDAWTSDGEIKDNTFKDNELDYFEYSFNGKSGGFYISRSGAIITTEKTNLKIEKVEDDMLSQNIITRISQFKITTEDGLEYTFAEKELSDLICDIHTSYHDDITPLQVSNDITGFPSFYPTYYFVSAWHLTSIKNPFTNKTIDFQYNENFVYILNSQSAQDMEGDNSIHPSSTITTEQTNHQRIADISSISLPENIAIKFTYDSNGRLDLYNLPNNGYALSKITITKGNKQVWGYDFYTNYLFKNLELDYAAAQDSAGIENWDDPMVIAYLQYLRLSLKRITKFGLSQEQPLYNFSYIMQTGGGSSSSAYDVVPPRAISSNKNVSGYYNVFPRNGLISRISYPATGGYTDITYEPTYEGNIIIHADDYNGCKVVKTVTYDGIDHDNDIVNEYNYYKHDDSGKVIISGSSPVSSVYGTESSIMYISKSSISQSNVHPALEAIRLLEGGNKNRSLNMIERESTSDSWQTTVADILYFLFTEVFPSINTTNYTITSKDEAFNAGFKFPRRYAEAEIIHGGADNKLGKTIYKFTSFDDVPPVHPSTTIPYDSKMREGDNVYGLPKEISVYDKNDRLLKKTFYKYNFQVALFNYYDDFLSGKYEPYRTINVSSNNFNSYKSQINWQKDEYYPIISNVQLIKTRTLEYAKSGNYSETSIDYTYKQFNFRDLTAITNLQSIVKTTSKGERIEKKIYYPYDYSVGGAIDSLKIHRITSVPISTETWITKPNDVPKLMEAQITDYQTLNNGDIKPYKTYTLHTDHPLTVEEIGSFDSMALVRKPGSHQYLVENTSFNKYDENGNLVQVSSKGESESAIYDYDGQYKIAEVENAISSDIAYTSFETSSSGNWIVSSINRDTTESITGKQSFDMISADTVKKSGLNPAQQYIVSYWTKNTSAFNISNTQGSATKGKTLDGWTYFEHRIKNAANVIIIGNGLIDELRLYPYNGRMTTYTYLPLIGKSSQCSANNNIISYDYDGLGRISDVKDENGNIIKAYQYHDKQ